MNNSSNNREISNELRAFLMKLSPAYVVLRGRMALEVSSSAQMFLPPDASSLDFYSFIPKLTMLGDREAMTVNINLTSEKITVTVIPYENLRILLFYTDSGNARMPGIGQSLCRAINQSMTSGLNASLELFADSDEDDLTPDKRRQIDTLLRSQFRIKRISQNISEYYGLINGELKLDIVPCVVSNLCSEIVECANILLAARKVMVVFSDHTDSCTSMFDQKRVETALLNILSNAVKYSNPNSKVTLSASYVTRPQKSLIFTVADEGSGISSDILPTIFTRFQEPPTNDPNAGAGFGLALSLAIARTHGGNIIVNSNENGTTVVMSIPDNLDNGGMLGSDPAALPRGYAPVAVQLSDILEPNLFLPLLLD